MDIMQPITNLEDLKQKQLRDIESYKLKSKLLELDNYPNFMQGSLKKLGNLPNEEVTPYELGRLACIIMEQEKQIIELSGQSTVEQLSNSLIKPEQNPFMKFINFIKYGFKVAATQASYELIFEEIKKKADRHSELFDKLHPLKELHTTQSYSKSDSHTPTDITINNNERNTSSKDFSINTLTRTILEVHHPTLEELFNVHNTEIQILNDKSKDIEQRY